MEPKHLHDQIARATTRLARLQARELLARQRADAREREAARRHEAQRRRRLGQLVIAIGGSDLTESEVVAALLRYREERQDRESRERAEAQGGAYLAALAASDALRQA